MKIKEVDLTELIWPLIWDKDEALTLYDSQNRPFVFNKGDRVIYPKQVEFLEAMLLFDSVLFGGAAGGGKSWIGRWAVVVRLMWLAMNGHPGARGAIFCETYTALEERHIKELPSCFPEWLGYFHDKTHEFRAYPEYGSWVLAFRNTDKYEKYRSARYAVIFIDESTMQDEAFFNFIGTRMRWATNGKYVEHCPILLGTNPSGPGIAWHLRRFVRDPEDPLGGRDVAYFDTTHNVQRKGHHFISARPTDNPANSPKYLSDLLNKPPKLRDAFYYGLWNVFEGQYFDLDGHAHTYPWRPVPVEHVKVLAIDYAWGHTAAAVALEIDLQGNMWVYNSYSAVGQSPKEFKKNMMRQFRDQNGNPDHFKVCVADPSMWGNAGSFEGNQTPIEIFNDRTPVDVIKGEAPEICAWQFIPANNDRKNGWLAMRNAFAYEFNWIKDEFGRPKREVIKPPKLRICSTLGYVWQSLSILKHDDKDPDDCVKTRGTYGPGEGDDEAEALRYAVMAATHGTVPKPEANSRIIDPRSGDYYRSPEHSEASIWV